MSSYSHFRRTSSLRLEESVGPITHLLSSEPHKKAIRRPKYLWASFPSLWRSCYICHTDEPRCHVSVHILRSSSDGMQSSLVLNTCAIVATPVVLTVAVKYRNCVSFARQMTRRCDGDCTDVRSREALVRNTCTDSCVLPGMVRRAGRLKITEVLEA